MNRAPSLPKRTLDYLANGAGVGHRNDELLHAACQYRDNGYSQAEAERDLGPRAEQDGLSEREILQTIAGAFIRPAREPIAGGRTATKARLAWHPAAKKPEPLPPIEAAGKFLAGSECHEADLDSPIRPPEDWTRDGECLTAFLYEPHELVNVVVDFQLDADGKARPIGKGVTLPRNEMIRRLRRGDLHSKAGGWLRMNPLDGNGIADANVTAFRFALVEFDDLPFPLQLSLVSKLPLPISLIQTSGGRSIHAWVRVNARDANEYRALTSKLLALLSRFGVDQANKNPSRLSRLPGVVRTIGATGDGRQRILYLNPDPEQRPIL
jgi:hypothetical protein